MNAREINFAYKVRHALNEQLDQLPSATTDRLASARMQALSVKRKEHTPLRAFAAVPVLATTSGGAMRGLSPWLNRAGLIIPAIVLAVGLTGMYNYEQQKHITETADIDAAVLSDDLPLSAYLDHGFSAYLARQTD